MKNKIKTIKTLALAGLVGISSLIGNARAGEVAGDIGYVQRENAKCSYAEANTFYQIPGKVNGFTFLDLYNQNGGVFAKTTLTKEIPKSGISARVQTVHANEICSDIGAGLEAQIPTPKGLTAKLNCTPLWTNNEKDTVKVGYFLALDLPWTMSLSSFGEANVANPKGITWDYGEVELAKSIGKLSIGYNAGLNCRGDGKFIPEVKHGIVLRYKF